MISEPHMHPRGPFEPNFLFSANTSSEQMSILKLSLVNLTLHHNSREGTALEIGARLCRFNI
jgi:hypothetical protein